MDHKSYQQNALRTESQPETLNVSPVALHALVTMSIMTANIMDAMKKTIFYGKELDGPSFASNLLEIEDTSNFLRQLSYQGRITGGDMNTEGTQFENVMGVNKRLLHASIGILTESGEMLEALRKQMDGGELDLINFGEELGDVDWYKAIAHDETGTDEVELRMKNIAKLRLRFPGKFTSEDALNRDLDAEREVLESTFAPIADVLGAN